MPLLRFRPVSGRCKLCQGQLELSLSSSDPSPVECPKCGQSIEPCPQLTAPPPRIAKKPSISEAKAAGFKVLKKTCDGNFETQ